MPPSAGAIDELRDRIKRLAWTHQRDRAVFGVQDIAVAAHQLRRPGRFGEGEEVLILGVTTHGLPAGDIRVRMVVGQQRDRLISSAAR